MPRFLEAAHGVLLYRYRGIFLDRLVFTPLIQYSKFPTKGDSEIYNVIYIKNAILLYVKLLKKLRKGLITRHTLVYIKLCN